MKIIANITLKCIKYLIKHRIEILQDKEGNLYSIKPFTDGDFKIYINNPVEIEKNGKEGIFYKNKIYILESSDKDGK